MAHKYIKILRFRRSPHSTLYLYTYKTNSSILNIPHIDIPKTDRGQITILEVCTHAQEQKKEGKLRLKMCTIQPCVHPQHNNFSKLNFNLRGHIVEFIEIAITRKKNTAWRHLILWKYSKTLFEGI